MEENPKLDLSSSSSSSCFEMDQKSIGGNQDHMNAFQYTTEKADSYVIDMDAFASGINKDGSTNTNSRITRSLSRKGSQRGGDRKVTTLHDNKDVISAICSPKGCCTPDKAATMAVGSMDHSINPHIHHQQINISGTPKSESKSITRRNSFIRTSSWPLDPKRVLIFFATLSSMGTMLLIYFTLITNKQNADEYEVIGSGE